ncbi:ATP-binding cassette domain-containing protein [Isoptericola dokdonensis]|jgi:ABC-2 type transport system ATP-binding protein|uniref:ATP-binding cassette domain-containing protein n=1 Tax=Isoptericola dokdonensis TaxID=372663 RepID=UPI000830C27F|nr:ATP-binding cassette domain-containing protein [Isoptericola dokdonensis]
MIQFDRVTYRYGRADRSVLDHFTWDVSRGRTVLLGPNGAGKSTLLGLGAGAFAPQHGSVHVPGVDRSQRSRARRRTWAGVVGWMPQDVRAVRGLTAREQVAYAGWLRGLTRSDAWERAAAALEAVDLVAETDRQTSALSGGQLRRVGIAEALVPGPSVLLLDEPTVGLDPGQRARVRDLLVDLPGVQTLVVSTHQVDDLSEIFDHVAVLQRGALRFTGDVPTFLEHGDPGADVARRAETAFRTLVPESAA